MRASHDTPVSVLAPDCLRRHRAFIAARRGGVGFVLWAPAVAQILLHRERLAATVLMRSAGAPHPWRLSIALTLVTQCVAAPAGAVPRAGASAQMRLRPGPALPAALAQPLARSNQHFARHTVLAVAPVPLQRLNPPRTPSVAAPSRWLRQDDRSAYPRVERAALVSAARAAAARAPNATAGVPAFEAKPPAPQPDTLAAALRPLTLPPQELSRVTDHVLDQLDHRVRSFRERQGLI